jgi:hypothetical protein
MSFLEQSIARTRAVIHEFRTAKAIEAKQGKQEKEEKDALLEKIIDDVCFQTGLSFAPENLPTIGLYVAEVLKDVKRRKAEQDEAAVEAAWEKRLGG